jgi:hypothetical protein
MNLVTYLRLLQVSILRPTLIFLRSQQCSNLLSIREPLCLDRRIGQEDTHHGSDEHRYSPDCNKEDSPTRELRLGETYAVCEKAPKYLSQGVAHIEPRYTAALLFFLIPHCDDQYEDWSNATFEDTQESVTDCKTGIARACCMATKDEAPKHDVDTEIQSESRDMLCEIQAAQALLRASRSPRHLQDIFSEASRGNPLGLKSFTAWEAEKRSALSLSAGSGVSLGCVFRN